MGEGGWDRFLRVIPMAVAGFLDAPLVGGQRLCDVVPFCGTEVIGVTGRGCFPVAAWSGCLAEGVPGRENGVGERMQVRSKQ